MVKDGVIDTSPHRTDHAWRRPGTEALYGVACHWPRRI